ncbi:MAG: hypothetical protein KAV00_18090, partial [Phycisphaerae bacterium]|nr:hypothetical protein [Phycisphaerae bacterium]
EFTDAGLAVFCCPGTNGWSSHGTRMDQAVSNVAKFARIAKRCDTEGLLNTNWGDYGHRNSLGVSLHSLAHGAACAWAVTKVNHNRFTERFCRHAFGDRTEKLSAALRTLGAEPGYYLYHALVEPFDLKKSVSLGGALGTPQRVMDSPKIKSADLRRRLAEMKNLRIPKIAGLGEFEAIAMEEFDLARRMDALACRRILLGRDLHAGKKISAAVLRGLARDMRAMADDFARLWRTRNRPSRLRDNLAAFKQTITEAERLA